MVISVHTPPVETRGEGPTPSSSSKARPGIPERAFALKPREPACVETVEFAEGCPLPATLRTALCAIRDDIRALRRRVAARGYIESIQGHTALVGIAEAEAIKIIRRIDRHIWPEWTRIEAMSGRPSSG